MEETNISKEFGASFELKIIQALLSDKQYGEQIIDILSPDLFDQDYAKNLASLVKKYFTEYKSFPTPQLLETLCKQEISNKFIQQKCIETLKVMKAKPLNGDGPYVKDNSLKYFKTQHLKNTLLEDIIPRIQKANFEEIVPVMQKAMLQGSDRNVGYDYIADEEVRFIEEKERTIPTPWKYVNTMLNGGGWGKGRLVVFLGPAGSGKSMFMVNSGVGALKAGKTVVHYTLELDAIDVARRYDACLTGVEINSIPSAKKEVLFKLKKTLPEGAKLIIKEYPMRSVGVQTIKSHLAKLRLQGIEPDMIVVDYGGILKDDEGGEGRFALDNIFSSLRALGQEHKIPVITGAQANRSAVNEDIVRPDHIAEGFVILMHCDIMITISRPMDLRTAGLGKLYFAKSRQGADGQIVGYIMDTSKASIEIQELTEDLEEKINNAFKTEDEQVMENMKKALKGG